MLVRLVGGDLPGFLPAGGAVLDYLLGVVGEGVSVEALLHLGERVVDSPVADLAVDDVDDTWQG